MLCDAAFWRAQIEGLANIASARVASYGLADDFGAMAELVLAQAPARFALAGHSMGGRVALEIWRRAPQRVTALGLFATDYRGHPSAADRGAEAVRRDAILEKVRADGMRGFAQDWVKQVVAAENLDSAELVRDVVAMMARQPPEACAAQTLAGLNRPDQAGVLPTIACPTLVCAGWEDALRPVAMHRDMAARIAGSRLVVIAHAAHMIAMEKPEAVLAAMRAWLSVG